MTKQTFYFNHDSLVKVWKRETFSIGADSEDEARKIMTELASEGELDDWIYDGEIELINSEFLLESEQPIWYEDNNSIATEQLLMIKDEDENLIWTNEPPEVVRDKKIDGLLDDLARDSSE
jgi:hypothetical protein